MTLTIELDDDTTKLLEQKATEAHMDFSEYVASILSRTADCSMAADRHRNLGYGEVQGYWITEDFDEPLEAFKDCL